MNPHRGSRIVLVEDEDEFGLLLESALSSNGHNLSWVRTLRDARRVLEAIPDLVLLDLMLPDGSGFELLEEIRRRAEPDELPIVILSGIDRPDEVIRGFALGANDYVTKPLDPLVLRARVEAQLKLRQLSITRRFFLRLASFELRGPLTQVEKNIEALVDELGPESFRQPSGRLLHSVRSSTRQMLTLVDDFLSVETLQHDTVELTIDGVRLGDVARDVVERSRVAASQKGVRIRLQLDEELGPVALDAQRIGQAIQHFVTRAVAISPPGTQVEVRTRLDAQRVRLEVTDQGPALSRAELDDLFFGGAPGRTTAESDIGLWFSRKIVSLHGGESGVVEAPEDGLGTTLWFALPVTTGVAGREF